MHLSFGYGNPPLAASPTLKVALSWRNRRNRRARCSHYTTCDRRTQAGNQKRIFLSAANGNGLSSTHHAEEFLKKAGFRLKEAECPPRVEVVAERHETDHKDEDGDLKILDPNLLLEFERNGHVALQTLFSSETMTDLRSELVRYHEEHLVDALRHACQVLRLDPSPASLDVSACHQLIDGLDAGSLPFLQHFHLRLRSPLLERFTKSTTLGSIAAQLLGCRRVRIYQDSLFVKRSCDRPTDWHSDLTMAPLDTNQFLTFWFPLRKIPRGNGLWFASKSHRDFVLPFRFGRNYPKKASLGLDQRYKIHNHSPLQPGDCTVHHGWCLHTSVDKASERMAYTVSYFADDGNGPGASTKLLPRKMIDRIEMEDAPSFQLWIQDIRPGRSLRHPLLPVVYEAREVSS